MSAPKGFYPGEFYMGQKKALTYKATGEFRAPKAGEYFLSGAIICAYICHSNLLTTAYWIAVPVEMVACSCCKGTGKVEKK